MLTAWPSVLRECCQIYTKLPSASTSTISGSGARHFRRSGVANVITICPRLRDGSIATYVYSDDVQLVVSDADYGPQRAQVQLSISSDGDITLRYTLAEDCNWSEAKLRVCVCGVLLADMSVSEATFNARTAGRLCDQHALTGNGFNMAIHPAGTHLAVSDSNQRTLTVYGLPDMNPLMTLDSKRNCQIASFGLCFTDTGTLLVPGHFIMQHWTLEGTSIASYAIPARAQSVTSRGNVFAVGCAEVHVCLLESGAVLHTWDVGFISTIAFVDASTLAVAKRYQHTICLYTLDGGLLRRLVANIITHGIAVCADGCLLVTDYHKSCVRVFASDGAELTTSPLAMHTFQTYPRSIVSCRERVYVLEPPRDCSAICCTCCTTGYKICVFE